MQNASFHYVELCRCIANSIGIFGQNSQGPQQSQSQAPLDSISSNMSFPFHLPLFNCTDPNNFSLNLSYLPQLQQLSMLRAAAASTEQRTTPNSTQWSPPPYVSSSTSTVEELEVDDSSSS